MLKTTLADAVAALQEAIAALPSGLEARSEFFVQWRTSTAGLLERLFADDHEPARQFKEIEFSPRRLTKSDAKDEQLKLDAYLAGCAAAKAFLEGLIASLAAPKPEPPLAAAQPEVQGEVQTPAVMVDASPLPEPEIVPAPKKEPQLETEPQPNGVVSGGTMETRELCVPVRSSLARVLGAWDKGDRDMALVLSAQLLADLTVLSRDEKFKVTFDKVVGKTFENGASEAVKSSAPLCVWSLVAAMNEIMRA